jgi:hypothetical protein
VPRFQRLNRAKPSTGDGEEEPEDAVTKAKRICRGIMESRGGEVLGFMDAPTIKKEEEFLGIGSATEPPRPLPSTSTTPSDLVAVALAAPQTIPLSPMPLMLPSPSGCGLAVATTQGPGLPSGPGPATPPQGSGVGLGLASTSGPPGLGAAALATASLSPNSKGRAGAANANAGPAQGRSSVVAAHHQKAKAKREEANTRMQETLDNLVQSIQGNSKAFTSLTECMATIVRSLGTGRSEEEKKKE